MSNMSMHFILLLFMIHFICLSVVIITDCCL